MIPADVKALAEEHLTVKQYRVFWWHAHDGIPLRRIAIQLDVARSSVQDSFDGACRTLRRHGVRFTPDGRPYLEETT